MIQKLPYYGINSKAKILLESYITNRFQRVQLDNTALNIKTTSMWKKVIRGVPQGSVLGPLLFLLYINDLPKAVVHNATPILFADDTSLIITERDACKLQNDLHTSFVQISDWFCMNFISVNINKTYFIQFSSKILNYLDINITYNNNYISKVKDINFLGININQTLSWKIHIDKILPKLSSTCFAMRTLQPFVSQWTLQTLCAVSFNNFGRFNILGSYNT